MDFRTNSDPDPADASQWGGTGKGANKANGRDETFEWPEPVDFIALRDCPPPILTSDHLPEALYPFVLDVSQRLGAAPTSVALSSLVTLASVMSEDWKLQPKRYDTTWVENARLWGAIVGPPSTLKSPIIKTVTQPIDRLDAQARKDAREAKRAYKAALAAWKQAGSDPNNEPEEPKQARYLVESTTVEALSEVMRDDGTQYTPTGKVLIRQDELSEFLANMDRYNGGNGSGDRGAYLRLYNGGRAVVDRIGRGSFVSPNWSACVLGGIQPDPIRRISRNAVDDGLLQRFVYDCPADQLAGVDRTPDYDAINRYQDLFPVLAAMRPWGSDPVAFQAEAHRYREEVDTLASAIAAMPDVSSRLQASLNKWRGLFARLCLTFHLIEMASATVGGKERPFLMIIQEETARRVTNYMRAILLPNLLRAEAIMFDSAQAEHAAWIAEYILSSKLERISVRDVVRAYGKLRKPEDREELMSVMASLVQVAWLGEMPQAGLNKPITWTINPRVHVVYEQRAIALREIRAAARGTIAEYVASMREAQSRRPS